MKLAVTMELYAYWNRLRGARSAPERNDVDPGAIRGVLADTFMLDFDEKRGFPFRIAGSRANAIFLKELRGLSFLELWRDADRGEIDLVCIASPTRRRRSSSAPRLGLLVLGRWTSRPFCCRFADHGSTDFRVLGGFAVHAAPAWMGLMGAGPITLTSLRALDSSTRQAPAREGATPVGFSLRDPPKRYKHLFVYSGDRPAT